MKNNEIFKIVKIDKHSCETCGAGLTFKESDITTCEYCGNEYERVVEYNPENGGSHEEIKLVKPTSTAETVENGALVATVNRETHEIIEDKKLSLLDKVNIGTFFIGVFLIFGSPILKERGYYDESGFLCVVGFIDVMISGAMIWLSNFLENRNQENEVSIQTADNTVETGTALQKKLG